MLYSLFGLVILVLNILAIIQVIASSKSLGAKLGWILVILLLPLVGLLIYFLLGR